MPNLEGILERYAATLSKNFYFLIDIVFTGLAFLCAYQIKMALLGGFSGLSQTFNYPFIFLLLVIISGPCYHGFLLYQPGRHLDLLRIFASIVKAVVVTLAFTLLFLYLWHMPDLSRLFIFIFATLNVLFLFSVRVARMLMHRYGLVQSRHQKEILVLGSHERAKDLIHYLDSVKHYGYKIIGCLEVDELSHGQEVVDGVKIIGTIKNLRSVLLHVTVDEVIFAMPLNKIENVAGHIADVENLGINVRILPDWQIHQLMYHPEIASVFVEDFIGLPTLALTSTPRRVFELTFKEVFDRGSALLGLIVLTPLFTVIGLIIKLTSRGPVFFKQKRSGLNGRIFFVYKFRSMVVNAEELRKDLEQLNEEDGPAFKIAKDPRVTWIGHLLRKTSLDELPQLVNVFKGEMSLVGPRPPLPAEVDQYDIWQRRRLSMKPGITCIWQVSGRNSVAFDQWMRMDLEYIDKWNLWLDFKLLLLTVPAVLFGSGR